MALSKLQVTQCITAVREDTDAARRIKSIFSAMGKQAGFTRNALMVGSNIFEQLGRLTDLTPRKYPPLIFDPNTEGGPGVVYQCTGIVEAARDAIERRQELSPNFVPDLKMVKLHSRSQGYAHAGVLLKIQDDTSYVLDWWATLRVANPLVFKFDDFDMNRKDAAREYTQFGGFS